MTVTLFLDNIEPTTDIKKRVCAEARALRAWAHFTLAIGWNCPPLVDHVLSADIKPTNYEVGMINSSNGVHQRQKLW